MNPCEEHWAGPFGNAYIERNQVDWQARIPFWRGVMLWTAARSALEVGCNVGNNLLAIKSAIAPTVRTHGVDVNPNAVIKAKAQGLNAQEMTAAQVGALYKEAFDLTFTAGVLIHIPPDQLTEAMQNIVQASRRYVLAVEYASKIEEMVEYRGHADRLWKRPFGKLYEQMGLKRVLHGPAPAFDQCEFWLMEKV